MKKEYKTINFLTTETKEIEKDGVRYGIVKGLFSTYGNTDQVNDRVIPGAFTKSLIRYKEVGQQIPLLFWHKELIGGIAVEDVEDTPQGLMGEAKINLEVQRGRESYALAKQGVVSSFSIGYKTIFSEMKGRVRELKEVDLLEVSMVPNPANVKAIMTDIKSMKKKSKKLINSKAARQIKNQRDFEDFLRDSGAFTRKASVYLAKFFNKKAQSDSEGEDKKKKAEGDMCLSDIVKTLNSTTERLRNV